MSLKLRGWIVPALLLGVAAYAVAEEMTLTTYYPSPRGVYKELRTTENTYLAVEGGNVGIGTASPSDKLTVAGNALVTGNTQVSGALQVAGTATMGAGQVNGNLQVNGNTQINGVIGGATRGFGGMFTYRTSDSYCDQGNPFTGTCGCPGGFTEAYIGGLTTCLGGECQTKYCFR